MQNEKKLLVVDAKVFFSIMNLFLFVKILPFMSCCKSAKHYTVICKSSELMAAMEMTLAYEMKEDDKLMEREGKSCSYINCRNNGSK